MAGYKVTYYDARGLAEPIRLLLSYGKVEFEDIRVPFTYTGTPPVLPQEIKSKCRWGQVPLLEFEGKSLVQSSAIARYLARKFNLTGQDEFEAALCDEYVDTIQELAKAFVPLYSENDPEKKAELLKTIVQTVSTKYLTKFEEIVVANGGQRLLASSVTWPDILLAYILDNSQTKFDANLLSDFPALKSLENAVFSIPQIKAWVEKRPKTEF